MTLEWSPSLHHIEILSVNELSPWKVCETSVLLPFEQGGNEGVPHLTIKFHSGALTLGKFAALRGFKGMNTAFLRRLARHVGVRLPAGVRAWCEATLVAALAGHFLGDDATDDAIKAAMEHRKGASQPDDVVKQSRVFDLQPDWVVDEEDDDPELVEAYNQVKQRRAAEAAMDKQRMEALQAMRAARASAGKAGPSDPAACERQGRKFVPVPATGYTAEQAKVWTPPSCSITKDTRRENRWRVRAPYLPGAHEKTKSYGRLSGTDDFAAMRFLLEYAWQQYTRLTGEECPFRFADISPPAAAAAASSSNAPAA